MRALYFKEIRSFLSSIIGYIFLIIFLLVTSLFLWVGSDSILNGSEASLGPLFFHASWISLILIPAITMRSIAEERRTGTIELLFTRPISDFKIILSKYLANVTLYLIAIIPTVIYYISVYNLAEEPEKFDHGATITSYLGLILIGGSFIAIGMFASAITNSQIVAFILALFICWIFLPYYGAIALLADYGFLGELDSLVNYFGMTNHYSDIRKGLLDTKDIVYFLSIIVIFLAAAQTVVKSLKK